MHQMVTEIESNSIRSNTQGVRNEMEETHASWKFWNKRRNVLAILTFFGFFNTYSFRATMSIALVAMTTNKTVISEDGNITYKQEFNWDSKMQGYLLSSFYYGSVMTPVFGGWLSARIGGRRVFGVGIGVTSILSLLTPVAAKQHFYLLLAVRIIGGAFEGVTFSCMHSMWAKWAPPLDRSKLITFSVSGCYVGTVVGMVLSGYLCDVLGWECVFYVFGLITMIWFCFWWFMIADSPSQDPKITKAELNYITESTGAIDDHFGPIKTPWKSIFTSVPVWTIVMVHFGEGYGFLGLLTLLPKFLKDILHYELKETGILAATPYVILTITTMSAGHLTNWFQMKAVLSNTQTRKICICSMFVLQSIFMLTGAYLASPLWTTVCMTLAIAINAFLWLAIALNYLDVAPQHAGVLMGIGSIFIAIAGTIGPIVAGYVVTTSSESEWQTVFWITSGILLASSIVYGSIGTAELQPWAMESSQSIKMDEQTTPNYANTNPNFIEN